MSQKYMSPMPGLKAQILLQHSESNNPRDALSEWEAGEKLATSLGPYQSPFSGDRPLKHAWRMHNQETGEELIVSDTYRKRLMSEDGEIEVRKGASHE